MKKLFLIAIVLIVLFSTSLFAQAYDGKFSVDYWDTLYPADSGTIKIDTMHSSSMLMAGRFFDFLVNVISGTNDTNFVDDSMFIDLQMCYDGITWKTIEIDTALDTGRAIQEDLLDADATVLPPFGRMRFIHWDSIKDAEGVIDTSIYNKKIELFWDGR